jgi:hypothetical protein
LVLGGILLDEEQELVKTYNRDYPSGCFLSLTCKNGVYKTIFVVKVLRQIIQLLKLYTTIHTFVLKTFVLVILCLAELASVVSVAL